MTKLKPVDYKILFELMKNAKRSDREIAKILGVSQATVSRRRKALEREVIVGYTAIPRWEKLGFNILALTFIKSDIVFQPQEKVEQARNKVKDWMMKHPNVVASAKGSGMGMYAFVMSFHKNYSDFEEFISEHNSELGEFLTETQTFLVNVSKFNEVKPFHLGYLADAK